jgi:hypothetical protein
MPMLYKKCVLLLSLLCIGNHVIKTQGIHVTEWPDLKAQFFAGINPDIFYLYDIIKQRGEY